jgi:hypothetical protein
MQFKRLLLFLAALWLSCFAAVTPTSMADISGDGNAHAIAASGFARMIIFVCKSTNTSAVLIGDSTIATGTGLPCAPGGSVTLPAMPQGAAVQDTGYQLSTWFYLIQSGDKLSILRFNQQ